VLIIHFFEELMWDWIELFIHMFWGTFKFRSLGHFLKLTCKVFHTWNCSGIQLNYEITKGSLTRARKCILPHFNRNLQKIKSLPGLFVPLVILLKQSGGFKVDQKERHPCVRLADGMLCYRQSPCSWYKLL
jgi:hypothetical protein